MSRFHKLPPELKLQVIERLAAFESPCVIARSLKRDYGIDITSRGIAFYDPTRPRHGRPPTPSLSARQVIAGCDGDAEAAVRWLIIANNRLARDLEYALRQRASGYSRARRSRAEAKR